jgi:hypothetical protein
MRRSPLPARCRGIGLVRRQENPLFPATRSPSASTRAAPRPETPRGSAGLWARVRGGVAGDASVGKIFRLMERCIGRSVEMHAYAPPRTASGAHRAQVREPRERLGSDRRRHASPSLVTVTHVNYSAACSTRSHPRSPRAMSLTSRLHPSMEAKRGSLARRQWCVHDFQTTSLPASRRFP